MGRPLRIEFEGALYHITTRGNEQKDIFLDGEDREKFFEYLQLTKIRYKITIHAYCLMNNHYHLLSETARPNLTQFMRDLNGHYTIYFNRRHRRCGHLFQGRYKAILVDKDSYLWELSRYIHLNPVRAKMIDKPEKYPYSSFKYFLGMVQQPEYLSTEFILNQFGRNQLEQIRSYKQFVYDGIGKPVNFLSNLYADCILGTEEFVYKISNRILKNKSIPRDITHQKRLRYNIELKDILKIVMMYYAIDKDILTKRKAKSNNSKKAFVYLVRKYTDCGLAAIKESLDNSITEVAVSKLFARTVAELKDNIGLRKDIEKLEEKIGV
ncbi:MAG: transposase [Candidatus Omnitrophica bacterium]|nr:transposase [Candidatus Omnitrophota bacterium]MBU0896082.1 transposase [Candidatus Omnitrophota bacterium]MBU2504808.1 transposase [Candidatus Omnitrophota bacterium]